MAIVKAVSSKASIKTAIEYVTRDEKTEDKLVSGFNCSPDTAYEEMQTTKEMWGKTGGRTYKHIVQSFHPDEPITTEEAHKIAQEFVERCPQFRGFEVLIATHQDKEHIHTHFIINSVSCEDGHKFQQSRQDLKQWKGLSDEILREHGLKVVEKGKTYEGKDREETSAYTKEAYQRQRKAGSGEIKSYVQDIALAIMEERENAASKEEFIANLKARGIGVDWQDNHKHITFIDLDRQEHGEKQCKIRDSKLTQYYNIDFSKETLENEFKGNVRKSEEREQQLTGAVEQIREANRRAEPIDKPVEIRIRAREEQEPESERSDSGAEKDSFRIFVAEGRTEDPERRNNKLGEFKRKMEETTNRINRESPLLERTLQQAGQTVQRGIEAGSGQQDEIEEYLRTEQQIIETMGSAVLDITAGLKRAARKVDQVGKEQLDIKDEQRELAGKQSTIVDRIGEFTEKLRELAEHLKNVFTRFESRGR